jgi:hypothetical protein
VSTGVDVQVVNEYAEAPSIALPSQSGGPDDHLPVFGAPPSARTPSLVQSIPPITNVWGDAFQSMSWELNGSPWSATAISGKAPASGGGFLHMDGSYDVANNRVYVTITDASCDGDAGTSSCVPQTWKYVGIFSCPETQEARTFTKPDGTTLDLCAPIDYQAEQVGDSFPRRVIFFPDAESGRQGMLSVGG